MRSTRASAAWAGVALATSFLSVAITSMQPHSTEPTAIAANVTLPSPRSEDSLHALNHVDAVESAKVTSVDSRAASSQLYGLVDRTP